MLTPQDFGGQFTSSSMGIGLFKHGELNPHTYLVFAQEDLAQPDAPRTRVNALANAKRALHFQVDSLTDTLGFDVWPEKTLRGFPRRLAFLKEFKLIAPNILSKINRLRNEVEHEYILPDSLELVKDYVEIVGLYLGSSDSFVKSFPHMREVYTVASGSPRPYSLCMKRLSGKIRLYECDLATIMQAWPEANVKTNEMREPPDAQVPSGIEPITAIDIVSDPGSYFGWARLLLGTD